MGDTMIMKGTDEYIVRTGPKNRRIAISGQAVECHFNGTTYDIQVWHAAKKIAEIPLAGKEKLQFVGFVNDNATLERIRSFLDKEVNRIRVEV